MIFFPDALFPDDHAAERAAAAPEPVRLHREGEVAEADWAAARAVIATHRRRFDAALAARMTRCKVLVRSAAGYDNVDLEAFGRAGIAVCNVPDYGTTEVADHAMALLLALARGVVVADAAQRSRPGSWDWRVAQPVARRLRGARLLVVGLGNIGLAVARRAAAFDMRVSFYAPRRPPGLELALGMERADDLGAALAEADMVSLHVPLTPATRGLFGAATLARMKPGALLVNTARGEILDLDALHDALRAGRLGGAALDVLPDEPPDPAHPLLRAHAAGEAWLAGRLILTPHIGFLSPDAAADLRRLAIRTALDALRDGVLRSCVNAHLLDRARHDAR
ncbi:NAD(P)-dependent oxidoreductase [Roseomonas sp. BN140053]|uniref:NAD(P)-dependent oxidoreductase n=1 Tax=Roseomonas sp. BN140053 TaxID=3391898 RepID=UPI0039E9304D